MKTSFKLALELGATLGSSFRTSVQGSQRQLGRLGSSIDQLKRKQRAIDRVDIDEANVGKARAAYNAASKELARLRREASQVGPPTRQLTQSLEKAQQRTERLSASLEKQRNKLQQSRQALNQLGISTRERVAENVRLGASVERLTQRYRKLDAAVTAQQNNQAKRAALRGQLFDAFAIGTTVAAPVKIAVDFEQSIAKLGSITRNEKGSEALAALEKKARFLGETTQFTASQVASSMTFLGMAGFSAERILKATPGLLQLAQASGGDLASTADIASNILSGFSLEASEMGRVGDVLAATFTTSNTNLQMLGDTLKFAAPVASATGASLEQVAAMAGLLGNVGIQGSMAGTALRAAFLRLSAPPKVAADALANLGVEVTDFEGNLRSVPEILKELSVSMEDLGSAERAEAIKRIFGQEAAAGLTELLKQAGNGALDGYIQKMEAADGSAAKMAKQMSATTAGSLKRLGSALEGVAINIGGLLLPAVAQTAEHFAWMAGKVSSAAQSYPLLTKMVIGVTVGLVAFKVVAIASAFTYTFLKGSVLSLVTAYRTLQAGMALAQLGLVRFNLLSRLSAAGTAIMTAAQWAWNVALTANPIGLIIAGVAALVGVGYALAQAWEPLGEFFSDLWDGMKSVAGIAIKGMLGHIQLLMSPLKLLGKAWSFISEKVFGGDVSVTTDDLNETRTQIGRVVADSPDTALPVTSTLPDIERIAPAQQHVTQQTRIDAPITIQATPGMDERLVAEEVKRALDEREISVETRRRAYLFDL